MCRRGVAVDAAVSSLIAIGAAALMYYLLERPVRRLREKFRPPREVEVPTQTG
jgi:peptidoglycan/LPS O-acetylase OafA/YrhL